MDRDPDAGVGAADVEPPAGEADPVHPADQPRPEVRPRGEGPLDGLGHAAAVADHGVGGGRGDHLGDLRLAQDARP